MLDGHLPTPKFASQAAPWACADKAVPPTSKAAFGGTSFAFGFTSTAPPAFGGFAAMPPTDNAVPSAGKAAFGESSFAFGATPTPAPTFGAFAPGAPFATCGDSLPAHTPFAGLDTAVPTASASSRHAARPKESDVGPGDSVFETGQTASFSPAASPFPLFMGSAAGSSSSATPVPSDMPAQPAAFSFGAATAKQDTPYDLAAMVRQAVQLETAPLRGEVQVVREENKRLQQQHSSMQTRLANAEKANLRVYQKLNLLVKQVGLTDLQAIRNLASDCGKPM